MQRIVHFHVPKTGGVSVTKVLSDSLGVRERRRRFPPGGRVQLFDHVEGRYPRPRMLRLAAGARYVTGHFHWATYQEMRPRADDLLVTFLRDPVERLRSAYRFNLSLGMEMGFAEFLSSDSPDLRPHLDNAMVRIFGGRFCNDSPSEAEWRHMTDDALRNLSRFAFVGFTERLTADLPRLFRLLDLPPIGDVPVANATPAKARAAAAAEIGDHAALLEERTRWDQSLFASASAFGSRSASPPGSE